MAVNGLGSPSLDQRPGLVVGLLVLAAATLWFVFHNVLRYATYDAVVYDDLWPRRFGLIPHIVGGLIAALTGLVQLWLGFTGRIAALHRILGRVYVAAVTVASAGGFYLAVTIDVADLPYAVGLFLLAVAWTLTTGMAILAVHKRALQQHREWMTRSYIVTFAFVTFRLASRLLIARQVAPPGQVYTIMAFTCWALPLLAAEPIIQWRRLRAH